MKPIDRVIARCAVPDQLRGYCHTFDRLRDPAVVEVYQQVTGAKRMDRR